MTQRPPEAERDELETAFTPILRRMWSAAPSLLAAAFVDLEGECIDYVSSLDPFEAKVSAAHALVLMDRLRAARDKLGLDEPVELAISGNQRDLWARRVSAEYLLVAVLLPEPDHTRVRAVLASAGREFCEEVGVDAPAWDPNSLRPSGKGGLQVLVRSAVGWPYAPASFEQAGVRVTISDVLGRWLEPSDLGHGELVCFRIRTQEGQELTLVHDPSGDAWSVRS